MKNSSDGQTSVKTRNRCSVFTLLFSVESWDWADDGPATARAFAHYLANPIHAQLRSDQEETTEGAEQPIGFLYHSWTGLLLCAGSCGVRLTSAEALRIVTLADKLGCQPEDQVKQLAELGPVFGELAPAVLSGMYGINRAELASRSCSFINSGIAPRETTESSRLRKIAWCARKTTVGKRFRYFERF